MDDREWGLHVGDGRDDHGVGWVGEGGGLKYQFILNSHVLPSRGAQESRLVKSSLAAGNLNPGRSSVLSVICTCLVGRTVTRGPWLVHLPETSPEPGRGTCLSPRNEKPSERKSLLYFFCDNTLPTWAWRCISACNVSSIPSRFKGCR